MLSEAVDIEGSMKDAMKLRIMSGKNINFNAINQAKLGQDDVGLAAALNAEVAKMGPEFETNHRMQKIFADGLGISVETMMKMRNATSEQIKLDEELLELKKTMPEATAEDLVAQKANEAQTEATIKTIAKWAVGLSLVTGLYLLLTKTVRGIKFMSKIGGNPIARFIEGFGGRKVLQGAAAMILVAASVLVLAGAMKVMAGLPVEALYMAIGGMTALVAAVLTLGYLMQTPAAEGIIIGAAGMVIVAAAILVLGVALNQVAKAIPNLILLIDALPDLALGMLEVIPIMPFIFLLALSLINLGAGMITAAIGFAVFGLAMLPLTLGLMALAPLLTSFGEMFISIFSQIPPIIHEIASGFKSMFDSVSLDGIAGLLLLGPALMGISLGLLAVGTVGLPGLMAFSVLAAISPALINLGNSFGMGSEDADSKSADSNTGLITAIKELGTELKGLRGDIQSQPILISVDGKVVSRISRMQAQQGSMRPPS